MRTITLIIGGGIAAYKALELIRLLKKDGVRVIPVLSKGGLEFVTPLSASALAGEPAYSDLFSLTDEAEMGHIRLARVSDLIVVAPASAGLIARMAEGRADDLASTLLLAARAPILLAPAMNPAMWEAPATQRNLARLRADGITILGPATGDTACGEEGLGRMLEPAEILAAIAAHFSRPGPLAGQRALVTAGPTREALDPVRFLSNHSSGKQGYAIAQALMEAGADVTLITGPTALPTPEAMRVVKIISAAEMHAAALAALPADIAICAAAVADWRPKNFASAKLKKKPGQDSVALELVRTPDILHDLAHAVPRPRLVIGFAAETEDVAANAAAKRAAKGCDWVLANDVSRHGFGADDNEITFITPAASTPWPRMSKNDIASLLVKEIVKELEN